MKKTAKRPQWCVAMEKDFEYRGPHRFKSPATAIGFLRYKFPAAHLRLEGTEKNGMISAYRGATISTGGGSDYGWQDVGELWHESLDGWDVKAKELACSAGKED